MRHLLFLAGNASVRLLAFGKVVERLSLATDAASAIEMPVVLPEISQHLRADFILRFWLLLDRSRLLDHYFDFVLDLQLAFLSGFQDFAFDFLFVHRSESAQVLVASDLLEMGVIGIIRSHVCLLLV
jgi:hypothetical protein